MFNKVPPCECAKRPGGRRFTLMPLALNWIAPDANFLSQQVGSITGVTQRNIRIAADRCARSFAGARISETKAPGSSALGCNSEGETKRPQIGDLKSASGRWRDISNESVCEGLTHGSTWG
jgi:hypothetical protein